jgi:hypothetical protein
MKIDHAYHKARARLRGLFARAIGGDVTLAGSSRRHSPIVATIDAEQCRMIADALAEQLGLDV